MKKVILSLALVAFAWGANAQYNNNGADPMNPIKTEAGTFTKPAGGTWIMEINATPDIGGGGIFSLPDINSDLGLVGLKARYFKSEKRAYRISATVAVSDSGRDDEDTEFAVGIGYGVEYHQKGAERLSTYLGWEANAGYVTNNNGYGGQTKIMGYGVGLFSGFDYYIIPKVYLGAELGYNVAVLHTDPEHGKNRTAVALSPGIQPSLRLGWQF